MDTIQLYFGSIFILVIATIPIVAIEYPKQTLILIDDVRANGFYSSEEVFCVVTKDRDKKDVVHTTIHELSHYLVANDKEHYLGVEQ